jgi:hypothetical protein
MNTTQPTLPASHVSGAIGEEQDDFLGAFNGYVRRPQPSAKGVLAQFYGENGTDADTILTLSMTQFQNQHIRASVYWVKDAVGAVKKQKDGFPLIAHFEGFIKRSTPKSTGMLATLFAPNGHASDAAHELGFSKYLDSFVHVQLHQFIEQLPQAPEFLKQSIALPYQTTHGRAVGEFKEASKILLVSGFFREALLWAALGGEQAYKQWLVDRPCCAPTQQPCQNVGQPTAIPNCSFDQYIWIPLCKDHAKELSKNPYALGGKHLLEQKRNILLTEWACEAICQAIGTPSLAQTNPRMLVEWAIKSGVDALLPRRYLNYQL